nr:immunoglobulin heavy chain junction region [Mus musculus]
CAKSYYSNYGDAMDYW